MKKILILFFILLTLVPFFFIKHKNKNSVDHPSQKLTVVCTTSIITDTVKRIAGDSIECIGLMGPGIDPHVYRPREGDVMRLATADIIFYNGLHLEGKMAHILKTMNSYAKTFAVTDGIPRSMLRAPVEFQDSYDPHVWLDVLLWILVVHYIGDTLCTQDPRHSSLYKKNSTDYIQELHELHEYVCQKSGKLPHEKRILVTAHDAFGYFGARYGFTVIGLQGMSTESQAGMKDMQNLVDYIVQQKVPALFVESSIPQRSLQAVQEAVQARNWNVTFGDELYSDALGNPGTSAETYPKMIRHNIDSIIMALQKN